MKKPKDLRQRIDEIMRDKYWFADDPADYIVDMGRMSRYLNYHHYYSNPQGCPLI